MKSSFDFSGKKVLVTGASSGMGRAVSIALAESGASVAMVDLNREGLDETCSLLAGEGHGCFQLDLCEEKDLTGLFDTVSAEIGKLSGIVHCAGIAPVTPLAMLTRSRLDRVMSINYYSFLELVRCIAKRKYREDPCSIVGISSINSVYPEKCMTAYVASKAAMNTAVQTLALELYKSNIRVNAVMPGIVNTPMARSAFEAMDESTKALKQRKQVLGTTEPEEIANVILFLLSDLSAAITGRTIGADGGYINF